MTATATVTLRLRRDHAARLRWAFLLSLLIHALLFTTWKLDQRYHFLARIQLPTWLFPPKRLAQEMVRPRAVPTPPTTPPVLEILPTEYVDVNPAVITAEPPKETRYYSTVNSQAANPNADRETKVPKIEGTQTRMTRTETVTLLQPKPLMPAAPVPRPTTKPDPAEAKPGTGTEKVDAQEELTPRATMKPGDLAFARPADTQRQGTGQDAQTRPRTFKEAIARLAARDPAAAAAAGLVGEKMRQDGGVKRRNVTSSLDVRSSPFAEYDRAIIYAVQARWYALLDSKNYAGEANGKLSLEFRLHQDGRVTDLKVKEQSVDEIYSIICQRAILDNAPFEKWPPDMRRMIGEEYREVTFTFYYN